MKGQECTNMVFKDVVYFPGGKRCRTGAQSYDPEKFGTDC